MTTRLLFTLSLLVPALSAPAQTAAKTFSKSFNATDVAVATLDLPGTVDVKVWNNPSIKIEITVSLASGNAGMLNELASIGRYNLKATPSGAKLLIQAPNLQKQVRVKGEVLKEEISYTVFVPKDLAVELPNLISAAVEKKP